MILFTNAGFMGLPAIQAILGNQAMLYGALFFITTKLFDVWIWREFIS